MLGRDHDKLVAKHLDPIEHRHERMSLASNTAAARPVPSVAAHGTLRVSEALGG